MAKKRKKKQHQNSPEKAKTFSNRPFVDISIPVDDGNDEVPIATPEEPAATVVDEVPLPEEDFVLAQMMDGAQPMEHKLAQKKHRVKTTLQSMDDSELVMRQLDELVHGKGTFDIADTDEFIEAIVTGLDKRIVKKLRKGEYALQGHLDLHGMNRDEARHEVAAFIDKSYKSSKKCVLIVHGRGLGSQDHIPVLKEKLRAWLTRGAMGKKVLAYTSAQPYDGGTGAVYVLLRS